MSFTDPEARGRLKEAGLRPARVCGTFFACLAFVLAATQPAGSDGRRPCRSNPEVVGKCFTVHGRLSLYNGTPSPRIWRIGTKRVLGVDETAHEEMAMPDDLARKLNFELDIYGDFEVCPLTKEKPGVMQIVCIESASHVVIKNRLKSK